MIGKAYVSQLPYYDRNARAQKFKKRPCLIIGKADEGDYVILPISTIPDKRKVDPVYDIPLNHTVYSFLDRDSYLRTHKQTVVNVASLTYEMADFKADYSETYLLVLAKVKEFQKQMLEKAR